MRYIAWFDINEVSNKSKLRKLWIPDKTLTQHAFFLPTFQKRKNPVLWCSKSLSPRFLVKWKSNSMNWSKQEVWQLIHVFPTSLRVLLNTTKDWTLKQTEETIAFNINLTYCTQFAEFTVEKCFNRRNRPVRISARDSHPFQVQPLSQYCTPMSNKRVGKCRKFSPFPTKNDIYKWCLLILGAILNCPEHLVSSTGDTGVTGVKGVAGVAGDSRSTGSSGESWASNPSISCFERVWWDMRQYLLTYCMRPTL